MRELIQEVVAAAKEWQSFIRNQKASPDNGRITTRLMNMLPYAMAAKSRLEEALAQCGYLPGKQRDELIPQHHEIADEALITLWRFCGLDDPTLCGDELPSWHVLPEKPLPSKKELDWGIETLELWLNRTNESAKKEEQADGPCNGGFVWRGKFHGLSKTPERLLSAMWDKRSRTLDDVIGEVWDRNKSPNDNAVSVVLSKLNKVLLEAGVPWTLSRKLGQIVRS